MIIPQIGLTGSAGIAHIPHLALTLTIVGVLVMATGVGMTVKVSRGDTHLETAAIPGSAMSWKATIAVGLLL